MVRKKTANSVPLRTLYTLVIGEGTITPSGGRYNANAVVPLSASPAADWRFARWLGPVADEYAPNTSVTLVYDETITAEFVHRPGIDTLDFAEAFSEFLVEIGHNQTPVLYHLSVDTGEFDYDSGAPAPNGIPDAAELAVLQQVLQDPEAEYGYEGGISHALMWDAYLENWTQADTDLAGLPEDVITTAAAYMTLGDWEHQEAMAQWLEDNFSVTVDTADYANEGGALFWADGDLDADGTSNQAEWDAAYAAAGGNAAAAVQAYAANAASQAQTGGATPWNAPPISDQDWQAALDEACRTVQVIVYGAPHLTVTGRVIAPGVGTARDVPVGQPFEAPVGSTLAVKAAPNEWFAGWSAPNTVINYSRVRSETLVLGGNASVTAVERAPVGFFLDNTGVGTLSYELTGRDPLVLSSEVLENGSVSLVARSGTLLRVTAHPYGDITPGLREPWGDGGYSYNGQARIDGSAAIQVFNAGTAYHGYGAVTVRGSNGLGRASARDYGSDGILDQALYHIPLPDANGNWTQYADWYFLPYVGFYIHCWSGPTVYGGDGNVAFYFQLANPDQDHPNPVYRAVVKGEKKLECITVCLGGCPSSKHGSVSVIPAKKYYTPDTEFTDQGEIAYLHAVPACDHRFEYWTVSGGARVYRAAGGGTPPQPYQISDLTRIYPQNGNKYDDHTIYVEFLGDVKVTAYFAKRALVVEGGGTFYGTEAAGALPGLDYVTTSLTKPAKQDVLDKIPESIVFVFFGHGGSGNIVINHDIELSVYPGDVQSANGSHPYKFVMLNCCESGANNNGSNWKDAFNADSFVGWVGLVDNVVANAFDSTFWDYIEEGMSTDQAFDAVWEAYNWQDTDDPRPVRNGGAQL